MNDGIFKEKDIITLFYSSTEIDSSIFIPNELVTDGHVYCRRMQHSGMDTVTRSKKLGLSIRCIKD